MDIDVERVASLAKLGLSDDEIKALSSEFKSILGYVDKLAELNLEGVEPANHPFGLTNAFRKDVPDPFPNRKHILESAPGNDGSFFTVPAIINKQK